MTTPVRLQLSRRKGFNLQKLSLETNSLSAVNVARPSRYGNEFCVGDDLSYYLGPSAERATAAMCVELYEIKQRALIPRELQEFIAPLRNKNLACWCKLPAPGEPDICHAAVLLELANEK